MDIEKTNKACACIERIFMFHKSEVFRQLDDFLFDDKISVEDQEELVSALDDIIIFYKFFYNRNYLGIKDLLLCSGYSESDIKKSFNNTDIKPNHTGTVNTLKIKNRRLSECIYRIFSRYKIEVLTFIDDVVHDDINDPQYSANTLLDRISDLLFFQEFYYNEPMTKEDFFKKNNKPIEYLDVIEEKQSVEVMI